MLINYHFKAFDTEIELSVISNENEKVKKLISKIEKNAINFEQKFSRFQASSELNRINNKNKPKIKVSQEMLKLLLMAKKAYKMTNGVFDPTIYRALYNSGYDKSFDLLKNTELISKNDNSINNTQDKRIPFKKLIIDAKAKTIKSPLGLKIDLGGIAKGYWVDSMKKLLDKYSRNYWISAGGDIFIKGKDLKKANWQLAVQNPLKLDENIFYLDIPSKGYGVATSGVTKRLGIKNGKKWSHIIDPRTDGQVENSILSVTVLAKKVVEADIMAKTVLILGCQEGLALVNSKPGYECLVIDKDLKMYISKDFKKFI